MSCHDASMSPDHLPNRIPSMPGRRLGALVLGATLLIGACGAPATPPPATDPPATPTETPSATPTPTPIPSGDLAALYRQIEDQVLEIRGLPAEQRLEPVVLAEDEARQRLAEQFEKDNPPDRIAVAEETLKALGLLPADADLGELYVDLLGSQVAGFYDPETKELVVVSRSGRIGANEKVTFAHEFVHALQDQQFGLEGIEVDAVGQGDRSLGRLALVEGDATLAMTLWLSKHIGPDELQELLVVDPEAQAQLEAMPAILRETLLFPYQQGLIFVNGLWARSGWPAVDAAYDRLPDSTEQVLHPEKYEARELPVEVPLDAAAVADAMGAGWSGTPEDTLGEFQLTVWLRENGVPALDATAAAAGWGGDRMTYLRGPDGSWALVMRTAWDTATDADEFGTAASTAVDGAPAGTVIRAAPTEVVVVLASEPAALDAAVDAAGGPGD
jgi:hypothetical protein